MKKIFFMILKLFTSLFIMLSVAFITLLERKYLGLTQDRLGVNKVTLVGMTQPLVDAIKLLAKEMSSPFKSLEIMFFLTPLLLLSLSLFLWESLCFLNTSSFTITLLFLLVVLSLKIISSLLVGWTSGSKYSTLGSLRVTAMSISFEVCFALVLYCIQLWAFLLNMVSLNLFLIMSLIPLWMMMILCDTMRTPFDLGEAESELVSGFNTEHMSFTFVFLFLAEYTTIIFLSVLTSFLVFMSFWSVSVLTFSFILMCRATYSRIKNDTLMSVLWWSLLPSVLFFVLTLL